MSVVSGSRRASVISGQQNIMKIVIAANSRMQQFVSNCIQSVRKLGYSVIVYDLGGLGFGKPFKIDDRTFQEKGYYHEIKKSRYSPGKHKPAVIKDCLNSYHEFLVYLDADTIMLNRIDDILGDYDIGLTVRPEWEVKRLLRKRDRDKFFIYEGFINTGVMCFNATEGAYRFLEKWSHGIAKLHEDQGAINDMLQKYFPLKSNQLIEVEGIKIRTFDTMEYNYYYFPQNTKSYAAIQDEIKLKWQEARILHFEGKMRNEYSRIIASL